MCLMCKLLPHAPLLQDKQKAAAAAAASGKPKQSAGELRLQKGAPQVYDFVALSCVPVSSALCCLGAVTGLELRDMLRRLTQILRS